MNSVSATLVKTTSYHGNTPSETPKLPVSDIEKYFSPEHIEEVKNNLDTFLNNEFSVQKCMAFFKLLDMADEVSIKEFSAEHIPSEKVVTLSIGNLSQKIETEQEKMLSIEDSIEKNFVNCDAEKVKSNMTRIIKNPQLRAGREYVICHDTMKVVVTPGLGDEYAEYASNVSSDDEDSEYLFGAESYVIDSKKKEKDKKNSEEALKVLAKGFLNKTKFQEQCTMGMMSEHIADIVQKSLNDYGDNVKPYELPWLDVLDRDRVITTILFGSGYILANVNLHVQNKEKSIEDAEKRHNIKFLQDYSVNATYLIKLDNMIHLKTGIFEGKDKLMDKFFE